MKYQIINGNNIDVLKTFPDNHFDSIVTDPPYGIDFLGKSWDANTGALETYQECLRVLKPGGHILAFSAARTYHHLAITLEQAGFEIRDQIMWIYSSGFPKSQDIGKSIQRSLGVKETITLDEYEKNKAYSSNMTKGKSIHGSSKDPEKDSGYSEKITVCSDPLAQKWQGWGTALKPAHEPIALARKPIKTSIKDNVVKHGTGALNIDATRVPMEAGEAEAYIEWMKKYPASTGSKAVFNNAHADAKGVEYIKDAEAELNENRNIENRAQGRFPSNVLGEIPDYQKYFYCPKVSRRERHIGMIDPGPMFERPRDENGKPVGEGESMWMDPKVSGPKKIAEQPAGTNNHPTVKPIELMKYLIKLVTPQGGKVLDPFNGSGSTGCAAVELGHEYVGIELDPAYVEIATKRIEAWNKEESTFKEIFE